MKQNQKRKEFLEFKFLQWTWIAIMCVGYPILALFQTGINSWVEVFALWIIFGGILFVFLSIIEIILKTIKTLFLGE